MKYKNIVYLFLALMVAMLSAQCAGGKSAATPAAARHEVEKQQVWQLVEMRGKTLSQTESVITLSLNPEAGTLHGRSACNRYFADCTLRHVATDADGSRYEMRVNHLGHGDVRCSEPAMETESNYLALLAKGGTLVVSPTTLLVVQKGRTMLKYEKQ